MSPKSSHKKCLLPAVALLWALLFLVASGPARAENRVLKLDGTASYVELPEGVCTNLSQATVEVWVKWKELRNFSRVFEFGQSWQSVSVFNHGIDPDLRFNIYPRNAKSRPNLQHVVRTNGVILTNDWIHLAAVSGPGGMLLYANGRLVGQHTNTASFARVAQGQASTTNYLGRGLSGNSTDEYFAGEMDEVRVWDHRRSERQIREGMFKRLSGREPGLVHLWNFDDGTANDATLNAASGKLMGNATVGASDLELLVEEVKAPVVAVAPPTQVVFAPNDSGAVAWWIAGALTLLVLVLAWLAFMFRRSGLGSGRIVAAHPEPARLEARPETPKLESASAPQAELKERALAELTSFAKESLVQGLFTQRAALIEAQKQAQQELVELETRLAKLDLPDRIQAYEVRIADLERQVASRGDEVQGLTRATLQLLRQKVQEEKQQVAANTRFN